MGKKTILYGLLAATALIGSVTSTWAQTEPRPSEPAQYGWKYRADMACDSSWIKVCVI